jgi:hypothetical protein
MPFIAAGIASVGAAIFGVGTVGASIFTAVTTRLLTSVAISALQGALGGKSRASQANGIQTTVTQTGADNPVSWVMGKYATAGALVCPPMSHGVSGKTPNAYLTYVVNLSDIAGMTLSRVAIDGAWVTLGGAAHPDYGTPVTGAYSGYAWVKYYNGSQTVVDPMLLAKYGSYPNRPWTSDMIGRGMCYAICTFRLNPEIFVSGMPTVLFEVSGIPLYDIRKDSTAGGSGTQRWATPSTWTPSDNPFVQIYNILRGVAITSTENWGGQIPGTDIDLTAAMNICDQSVSLLAGGSELRYRSGLEVFSSDEPASIIEQLLLASSGDLTDIGGVWKARAGSVGLPVYMFTDDDLIITQAQLFDPFPAGLKGVYNAASATYPDPVSVYQSEHSPQINFTTYEAEDRGQRLVSSMSMPAVTSGTQVQRLCRSFVNDNRRFRRHTEPLPPSAVILEPLDGVSWTSTENGYTAKVFEIEQVLDDVMSMVQTVSLRERDSADYNWSTGNELPLPVSPGGVVVFGAQAVPSFAVAPFTVTDGVNARRPAIQITWSAADLDGIRGIEYEVTLVTGGALVKRGFIADITSGSIIVTEGIAASVAYNVRARLVADWSTSWTALTPVTSPAVVLTSADMLISAGVGKSLNVDPNFADPSAWTMVIGPATFQTITDGISGTTSIRGVNGAHCFSRSFPVSANKKYRLRGWIRRSATADGNGYLRMYFYDGVGAQISYDENNMLVPGSLGTAWIELNKSPIVPPVGAVTATVTAILNYAGTAGYHEAQGLSGEEMVDDVDLVNGSVSRTRFLTAGNTMTISATTAATAQIFVTKTWSLSDFKFNNAIVVASSTLNPLKITYGLRIGVVAGGVKANLRFTLQYRLGGSWIDLFSFWMYHSIPAGFTQPTHITAFSVEDFFLDAVHQWDGFRLAAYSWTGGGNTGASINIDSCDIVVEQISR